MSTAIVAAPAADPYPTLEARFHKQQQLLDLLAERLRTYIKACEDGLITDNHLAIRRADHERAAFNIEVWANDLSILTPFKE